MESANIEYEICTDYEEPVSKGFSTAPILKYNDKYMLVDEAIKWILERTQN